jgi:hypothetical protein
VRGVVPFATRTGTADVAKNARLLDGHKASTRPRAGTIPVLGTNGKLHPALGVPGPAGPQGAQGTAGAKGDRGSKGDKESKGDAYVMCASP